MWIAGGYIDPIYIVLFTIIGVFCILSGLMVIMWELRKILKGIESAAKETKQNTDPMRKLEDHYLLLERTVTRDIDIGSTQSISRASVNADYYYEKYQRYKSGYLHPTSTEQPTSEPLETMDTE